MTNETNETNDDLERRLREGLHQEAELITPNDRRAEILAMAQDKAQDKAQTAATGRRWLAPVAAAASVALIGTVIWGVSSDDSNNNDSNQAAPAVTRSAASPTASEPAAGSSEAPAGKEMVPAPAPNVAPPPASGNARTGATTATLPVYFLGLSKTPRLTVRLYREFVRTPVPAGATEAQRAKAALSVAMKPFLRKADAKHWTSSEIYMDPWSGTSVKDVTVTPTRITITLNGAGYLPDVGAIDKIADDTKLGAQQLVWTAQAAVGKGAIPVKFDTPKGARLFGRYSTAQTYNRPPPNVQFEVLAPIWITSPVYGQAVPAGAPVVAAGQSCAFEGTTQWQLKQGVKVLKSGFATATSGCPTRGTWQVKLGVLAPGSYTFRMYELSQEDGKRVIADTSKPFTVR